MDDRRSIRLHRCRFIDWSPSPITSIAFPPTPLPPLKFAEDTLPILAIGHANGNIEIWKWANQVPSGKASQGWVHSQTFFAPRPSKVDCLVFTWRDPYANCGPDSLDNLRLFSTSGGSGLLEWELSKGTVKRFLSSQGGSIWSLAANPSSSHLALGCEDGCVRLVSLQDEEFTLQRKFDRVKCRILSIAWGPPSHIRRRPNKQDGGEESEDEDDDQWEDNWLVTGCSDSSLRKWDVRTGRVLERMSTDRTRSERTLVWAVGALADGTIVSGDSMGMVKFWDPVTSTQLQSFTAHGADVLCLTVSAQNNAVYTSGVDQKVAEFVSIEVSAGKPSALSTGKHRRWIQSCSRRLHSHDVRCVAMWPPQSVFSSEGQTVGVGKKMAPLLVTGGLDMSPVFTPCATPSQIGPTAVNPFNMNGAASFEEGHYHRTSFTSTVVSFSSKSRLVACRHDSSVVVWRIPNASPEDNDAGDFPSRRWTKVLDMQLKFKNNISATSLSIDGQWLAVSDYLEVKLFRLPEVAGMIEPKRMKTFSATLTAALPEGTATGATALTFTADSKRLIVGTSREGVIVIVDLDEETDVRVVRTFDQHRQPTVRSRFLQHRANGADKMDVDTVDDDRESNAHISLLSVSADGQWLASSDSSGKSYIFNLDSLQHHCALPAVAVGISALTFDTKVSRYLLLGMPNNSVRIFDIETKSFPDWQKDFVAIVSKKLSTQRDPIMGASFVPLSPNSSEAEQSSYQPVVVWGSSWMCRFRVFPRGNRSPGANKRGRDEEEEETEEESGVKEPDLVSSHLEKTTGGQLFLTVFTQYRNLLGVSFLGWDEIVVVERPLLDVLSNLPPAYFKAKYGT